jgi:ligand-binding SRPBCC domain-containing protein
MAMITVSTRINAPVEKVFKYMHFPENQVEIWPSLIEVRNVSKLPNGGHKFDWTYKMAGMRFQGYTEDMEFIPNSRVVANSNGGIQATFTWIYEPENGGTKITVQVNYTVPIPLLGKLAETFIVRQNEKEAETLLANLKTRMEVSEPLQAA